MIQKTEFKGIFAYLLKTPHLEVIITEYGAKIQSIRFDGKEYLWQNRKSGMYKLSSYADSFVRGEFSGFDEMFPNISAGPYPDGKWKGTMLPDHGEVWSRSWHPVSGDDFSDAAGLSFVIDGVALPYQLEKNIRLQENSLCLSYRATNHSDESMKCIWAAHPLFILEDGMELSLPECRQIINVYGGRKYLGEYGKVFSWPVVENGRDMHILSSKNHCSNKYYVYNQMKQNTSRLCYPDGTEVTFTAPVSSVPYLGIWTDEDCEDMSCAAPEPCTGAYDTLVKADEGNAICVIPPNGCCDWDLKISFSHITAGAKTMEPES